MSRPAAFRRDRVTWTGYGLIGTWAFVLYFVGPASSAITAELDLTDAQQGLIGTALALGLVASSVVGPAAVRRWGRAAALVGGLLGLAAMAVLLVISRSYGLVLVATAGIGLSGALTANTATAVLSDHHRPQAARAITEGNATASWLGVVSPAMLGFFIALPVGWRGAGLVLAVLPVLMLAPARRIGRPSVAARPHLAATDGSRLPRAFWPALVTVSVAVACEFCVNFWAAQLVSERTGAQLSAAAAALSAVTLGMALGRTFLAAAPQRYPLGALLVVFFLLTAVGVGGLLLAPGYLATIAALFVIGLGLSVLYPFAQAMAIGIAGAGADRAVGLTAVAAGLAMGAAPFVLGMVAAAAGLVVAFSVEFLLVALGVAATVLAGRLVREG